jgi:hypothetical protein
MDERERGAIALYNAYAASHQYPVYSIGLGFCHTWWGIGWEEQERFRNMYDALQAKGALRCVSCVEI